MTIFNYTVNSVDLIIAGIFLFFTIVGIARGMFITIVNFIRYVFGFALCIFCSNRLAQPVYDSFVRDKLIDAVRNNVTNTKDINTVVTNLNNMLSSLPKELIATFGLDEISIKKSPDLAKIIVDDMLQPLALMLVKATIFIAVLVVFFLVTGIVIGLIKKHIKKKKSKSGKAVRSFASYLDKILGGIFGAFKGAIVVFVLVSIITALLCTVDASNSQFLTKADNSIVYNTLVTYNPFNTITEGII